VLFRSEGVELLDAFVGTQESGENPRLGEKLRLFSAYFLARLDRKAGLDYLASMVKSGSDSQRKILAAEALGKSDNPRAAAILIGALPSADADLKLIVARGLGKLGGARSIRALKKMSQDSDPESRAAVDAALMELGEK
jgi:HEAT repeat protein